MKAAAFDTSGTILDWHSGLVAALGECGARAVDRDWHELAVSKTKAGLRLKRPKSRRGLRTLSIRAGVVEMLRAYRRAQL